MTDAGARAERERLERLEALTAQLRQAVDERSARLAATNAELEAFSYTVSHDLRAPLRAVLGFSAALREDYAEDLPDGARAYLRRIEDAAVRMDRLIEGLLQLSRLDRAPLRRRTVDLSHRAGRVVEQLRIAEPERGVQVQIAQGLEVQADPRLVEALLSNLLGNAWKYTRDAAPAQVSLTAAFDPAGERVYRVADNGVGFDPRAAERIFQPFQRLHEDFDGSGIGLATVKRVVQRHGGRVWAKVTPGGGTTVCFTLPQPAEAAAADGAGSPT